MTPQTDGKTMIGGQFTTVSGVSRNAIARINSNGTLDTTFVVGTGFAGPSFSVQDIGINSSGDYFVGGQFTSYSGVSRNNIIKLTSTGSIDNSFNVGTGTNNLVNSVLVQNDGKVIIVGFFTSYSSTTTNRIVKLNTNGTIDNTFNIGTGFNNDVFQAVQQTDGKIICVGAFTSYSGISVSRICRLNTDGSLDTSFTSLGFNGNVTDVALDVDGNIICVGQFTTYNGLTHSRIIKLNPDGTVFTGWNTGNGAGLAVFTVTTLPDRKIIIGGSNATTYDGYFVPLLFMLSPLGTLIDCILVPVTPTPSPTKTPTVTPTNSPTATVEATPTNTMTQTPSQTSTQTNTPSMTQTPSQTSTQTNTPSMTQTPSQTATVTPSPTCGTYTTQYMEVILQSCHNFALKLFDNPDLTGNANAVCDVVVSGCAYGDQGTVYCGTETIASGDHVHNFSLQPVLLPGECVSAFTVNSITEQCPCYEVIYVPNVTPTPSPTTTMTQTPSPSVTNTPSQTGTPPVTPTSTINTTPSPTPSVTMTNSPTTTMTPTVTPTSAVTTCCVAEIRTDASLDITISGLEVSGVTMTYLSGDTLPIAPSDPPGYYGTFQTGSSVTVVVSYNPCIAGQNIILVDCNGVGQCCDLNPGGGNCTFTGVDLSCGCQFTITGYDGTCT